MVVCYTRRMNPHPNFKADGRFWLTLDAEIPRPAPRRAAAAYPRNRLHLESCQGHEMSYKAAWEAVDAMNSAWQSPLVDSARAAA